MPAIHICNYSDKAFVYSVPKSLDFVVSNQEKKSSGNQPAFVNKYSALVKPVKELSFSSF